MATGEERDVRRMQVEIFLAFGLFLLTWGIGQALALLPGELAVFISLLFYVIVYIGISGIAIPLFLTRKYGLDLHSPASKGRTAVGVIVFLAILGASVLAPDGLPVLLATPPAAENVIKYLLLFTPMSLGISLHTFFLIPKLVTEKMGERFPAILFFVLACSVSLGISFWVDQLFRFEEVIFIMLFLGAFFGLSAFLTRSLVLTYLFFLPAVLISTLSEGKYFTFPIGVLVIGFVFSFAIVLWHLKKSVDQKKEHSELSKTA